MPACAPAGRASTHPRRVGEIRPGTIVVVDDEQDLRELLCELLQNRGYVVDAAGDGIEALAVLRDHDDVGLLLLDLRMPNLDGVGVLAEMEADPALRDIPVCMATATPELVPAGITYMTKPIAIGKLFTLIDHYLVRS